MATPCCPTDVKPVVNNYVGTGTYVDIEGHFKMYMTKNTSTIAIMELYDVFGSTPHTEQFADYLAEATGYVVCVPDIIGDAWDPKNIPPTKEGKFPAGVEPAEGVEVLINWILTHHNTRLDRSESIEAVKKYLEKAYKITKLGVVGMCWGAKVAFTAANKTPEVFDAIASCHGSFLEKADVEKLDVPMCFLNSKDEPESYTTEIKPVVLGQVAQERRQGIRYLSRLDGHSWYRG